MLNWSDRPLRDVISDYGLAAQKSLGQHFLLDSNLTEKIARLAGPLEGLTVIEVGPGPGGLTRALLGSGCKKVIAFERDARCVGALQELTERVGDQLTVIETDALKVEERLHLGDASPNAVRVVANLPYNISTALLTKWLMAAPRWWGGLALMFQKEVGERILAAPHSKVYGRLSVVTQLAAHPKRLLDVPARAFTPPPKVESMVVGFEPHHAPSDELRMVENITREAFSGRRKMLRSSLKRLAKQRALDLEALLNSADIKSDARADQISPDDYFNLAQRFLDASRQDAIV